MKLKFKPQPYQTYAVEAVVDCFAGQPESMTIEYRVDPSRVKAGEQQQPKLHETVALSKARLEEGEE